MADHKAESSSSSLTYQFPVTFKIGKKETDCLLVNTAQLKGHLALLNAFSMLRAKIEGIKVGEWTQDRYMPKDKDKRWVWFVGFAVERFESWVASLEPGDVRVSPLYFLPPVDVLMVWHTYMLNPQWYAEDCARLPLLQNLTIVEHLLAEALTDPSLYQALTFDPTDSRLEFWSSRMKDRSFDALEDVDKHQTKTVECPLCRKPHTTSYVNVKGDGYLQKRFKIECCSKSNVIGTSMFALRKFAEDLVREDEGLRTYLAGTVRTNQSTNDTTRARTIKHEILSAEGFQRPAGASKEVWIQRIISNARYTFASLQNNFPAAMQKKQKSLMARILSAYGHRGPFSVDLIGAVLRQGSFIKKMQMFNWTDPTYFETEEDEIILQHAVARYHGFLDLMTASSVPFHVPTLDIDLVWHTHQLLGKRYHADCLKFVGKYVDHNDKVEQGKLASSFDHMCRAWKDRFNVPYTHCGCPEPGDKLTQRLAHVVRLNTSTPPHLLPPTQSDSRGATHPSEHDSIVYGSRGQSISCQQRDIRWPIIDRRWKRQHMKLTAASNSNSNSDSNSNSNNGFKPQPRRWCNYYTTFMRSVPYGYYGLACAANDGHVVDSKDGMCCDESIAACMTMDKPYVRVPTQKPATGASKGGGRVGEIGGNDSGGGGDGGGGGFADGGGMSACGACGACGA